MNVVKQSYEILTDISYGGEFELMDIERAARTCYRSEDKILDQAESAKKLVRRLIESGHEAMLEHGPSLSVRFTTDRAIANELVRHRLASFAQESTRYCNYSQDKFGGEITCIEPPYEHFGVTPDEWRLVMECCERHYLNMLKEGVPPQIARGMLPLSLATNLVVTANYREWRHIFKLRTAKDAHPQIRELLIPLLLDLKERLPIIFDDIEVDE